MDDMKLTLPWATPAEKPITGTAITGYPPTSTQLLEPHLHDAFHAWRTQRSPQAAGALLKAVDPILNEATRSYAGGEANTATSKARAKSMALEAFERYDPERAKLKTHLLSHLRGLRRATQRAGQAVYVPEQSRLDSQRLSSSLPELTESLGRHPSDAELSGHTGLSIARIAKARAVPGVLSSSQAGDSGGGSGKVNQAAWDTWVKAIYLDAAPTDQKILEHSLGLHGNEVLPANEIAKLVGLSPGAISQRKQKLQQELDQFETFMGRAGNS